MRLCKNIPNRTLFLELIKKVKKKYLCNVSVIEIIQKYDFIFKNYRSSFQRNSCAHINDFSFHHYKYLRNRSSLFQNYGSFNQNTFKKHSFSFHNSAKLNFETSETMRKKKFENAYAELLKERQRPDSSMIFLKSEKRLEKMTLDKASRHAYDKNLKLVKLDPVNQTGEFPTYKLCTGKEFHQISMEKRKLKKSGNMQDSSFKCHNLSYDTADWITLAIITFFAGANRLNYYIDHELFEYEKKYQPLAKTSLSGHKTIQITGKITDNDLDVKINKILDLIEHRYEIGIYIQTKSTSNELEDCEEIWSKISQKLGDKFTLVQKQKANRGLKINIKPSCIGEEKTVVLKIEKED